MQTLHGDLHLKQKSAVWRAHDGEPCQVPFDGGGLRTENHCPPPSTTTLAPAEEEAAVSPLAMAARMGDLDEVQRLLAAAADPNEQDSVGETPLFEAVASSNTSVACALLLAGADPEWQSHIGGVPADLADETSLVALLKVTCGEPVEQEEQDEIISAVDYTLRQPVLRFIMSLTGEDEEERKRAPEEAFSANSSAARREEASSSMGSAGPRKEDVDVVVSHAIQESSLTVRVPSNATFGDVKKAIFKELNSDVYLVKKEHDMYQAYKDSQHIGLVREVRMVGASLPAK
mmetsp:Transcript_30867/g.71698  ORF Transcript_30867/g.71698 Transcript_30867/m.71698 type:complete len:289 (-) Transcript_30867:303-1169(-)|eukprot:CAMPEP_0171133082 /NCGR_PEP_ID=MMETSP0766_2-20121228/125666_1 /TAXON_ID=439317 /ORGANISM="Gambierdiscus australes, Strain CAWD 149" /LENGTH=288 /DNA_ID=CAMNT_0011596445 /DNA_START=164 /DNA_END=1030 /DNA_ORIENTATION=-